MDEERLQKLKERVKKIGKIAKDYVPEIAGAAIGAAFGNAVVGAIIGTTAKKLFDSFIAARQKTSHLSPEMQQNIEKFSNATVIAYGKIQPIKKQEEMLTYTVSKADCSINPEEIMFKTSISGYDR